MGYNMRFKYIRLEQAGKIPIGDGFREYFAPEGVAMYHSKRYGKYYVIISDRRGNIAQYELFYNDRNTGENAILAKIYDDKGVPWALSKGKTPIEGIVADDEKD